jgi:cytochrome c peroxidase
LNGKIGVFGAWLAVGGFVLGASAQERTTPSAGKRPARPLESVEARDARTERLRSVYTGPSKTWPAPDVDPDVRWSEIGLLPPLTSPADNPTSPAKVELGKRLFFDPRVSGSGQIACASCHDPDLGWADGRTISYGHRREPLRRNAPGLMNVAYMPVLFWDGRASSLEDQARQVMLNPSEMSATPDSIIREISAVPEYRAAFREVFESDRIDVDVRSTGS